MQSQIRPKSVEGVLAHAGGLEMDSAFAVLRRYARDHGTKPSDASQVVERELKCEPIIEHARSLH